MNPQILKQTLRRTLKWYPVVIGVMTIVGFAFMQKTGDILLSIGVAMLGAIVGPGLEATFYYLEQLKKAQAAPPPGGNEPAHRLRQADQLRREGLISAEEYEHIRQSVLAELGGERGGGAVPEPVEVTKSVEEIQMKSNGPMKLNPWLAMIAAATWPAVGFLLVMILGMILKVKFSRLESGLISLPVGLLGALYIFPIVNQVPFGPVPLREYLRRIGFYLPANAWRHVVLGVILAGCTLTGMAVGSLLTGRYVLDWNNINLGQIVFSLNPGFFEEIFYRGIVVMLLLPLTRSLTKALAGQILVFGLAHIKSLDGWALFDVVSVMVLAIAFTYAAYKTRTLLAGIVFHFLHDALLYFVQVPGGNYVGWQENLMFYAALWLMVGVACLVIWYASERLHVRAEEELYVRRIA